MKTDTELIVYALRYLADDCEDHRPLTAERMRQLATRLEEEARDNPPDSEGGSAA